MSTLRTVAFHTLGCKLNYSETSSISSLFRDAGYEEVDFKQPSDIYVINTCSVTDQADKKCRKAIRTAVRTNPNADIYVIGCYAQLKPKEITEIPGVRKVLGAAEKFNILQHIKSDINENDQAIMRCGPIRDVDTFVPSFSFEDRTRSFLKVQDGCDYKCSFCTIPQARGKSRSGSIENLVANAQHLISKGAKEIVLTGVNIGDFGNGTQIIEGLKPKKEDTLIDLLRALEPLGRHCRFRISSIEPNLCTNEIIDFVLSSHAFMPHFHMPLQSGDNEILAMMKRRYRRELYEERVSYIKESCPSACIGVDVIVGFPGETDAHFQNTYHFLKELNVSYLHVFPYSERNNTPASELAGKVPFSIRHTRSEMLRILSEKKKRAFYNAFHGTHQQVLLEQSANENYLEGWSKNYLRIRIQKNDLQVNDLVDVTLHQLLPECVFESSAANSATNRAYSM